MRTIRGSGCKLRLSHEDPWLFDRPTPPDKTKHQPRQRARSAWSGRVARWHGGRGFRGEVTDGPGVPGVKVEDPQHATDRGQDLVDRLAGQLALSGVRGGVARADRLPQGGNQLGGSLTLGRCPVAVSSADPGLTYPGQPPLTATRDLRDM
jgi:hypothetical protein